MPNSDWNQRIRQEVAAIKADSGPESTLGCQADALKSLLNTIVNQITDADKRHTDVLGQLQDRLSGLGEDRARCGRGPPTNINWVWSVSKRGWRSLRPVSGT